MAAKPSAAAAAVREVKELEEVVVRAIFERSCESVRYFEVHAVAHCLWLLAQHRIRSGLTASAAAAASTRGGLWDLDGDDDMCKDARGGYGGGGGRGGGGAGGKGREGWGLGGEGFFFLFRGALRGGGGMREGCHLMSRVYSRLAYVIVELHISLIIYGTCGM